MSNDSERLDKLLSAFEEDVIDCSDDELGALSDPKVVSSIIFGVLKAHGYARDGSRVRSSAVRAKIIRRTSSRTKIFGHKLQEPLRANFSVPEIVSYDTNSDEDD